MGKWSGLRLDNVKKVHVRNKDKVNSAVIRVTSIYLMDKLHNLMYITLQKMSSVRIIYSMCPEGTFSPVRFIAVACLWNDFFFTKFNNQIRNRLKILLLILREFNKVIKLYSPWNHQKTKDGFEINSRVILFHYYHYYCYYNL